MITYEILKKKLNKMIIPNLKDDRIKQIIKLYNNTISNDADEILIEDNNIYYFKIIFKKLVILCYKTNKYFTKDFYPLQKLNKIRFNHVSKILEFDDNYNIIVLEKLEMISKNGILKEKFVSSSFIKSIIYIAMKIIFTLFIYNKQYTKKLEIKNFGINSLQKKGDAIKVNNLGQPIYLDPNNEEEVRVKLYYSLEIFIKNLIKSVQNYSNREGQIKKFFNKLKNEITFYKIVENPTLSGTFKKEKIRMFKAIDVEGILNYIMRQNF